MMARKPMASRRTAQSHQLSISLPDEHQLTVLAAEQSSRDRNRAFVVPNGGLVAQNNHEEDSFWLSFPVGYRFSPRDDELLEAYLKKKVEKQDLPLNNIKDVNIYNYNPEQLAAMYRPQDEDDKEWYFFTPREKKYPNGTRPKRAAGDGYWKATGADKQIMPYNSQVPVAIGTRKALVFYKGRPPKGAKTNWIMHEYKLECTTPRAKQYPDDMRLDDWTLVRMYEKSERGAKANAKGVIASQEDEQILNNAVESPSDDLESPNSNTSDSIFVEGLQNEITVPKVDGHNHYVPVHGYNQHVPVYSNVYVTESRHNNLINGYISPPNMFPSDWNNNGIRTGHLQFDINDFGTHTNEYVGNPITDTYYNHNVDISHYFDFHHASSSGFNRTEYLPLGENVRSMHMGENQDQGQ